MNSSMLTGNAPGFRRFGGMKRQRIMLAALATVALMLTAAAAVIPQLADDSSAADGDTFTATVDNALNGTTSVAFKCKVISETGLTAQIGQNTPMSSGYDTAIDTTAAGALTIPETVTNGTTTYAVTNIAQGAFYDCTKLTFITIPDSVTIIGASAFEKCTSVASIDLPVTVTAIGGYAFYKCANLIAVDLPDNVSSIGVGIFKECTALKAADISKNITSIPDFSFESCTSLTSIAIPNTVTSVGMSSFEGCTLLASITIPDSVKSIGYYAFRSCSSVTSITFGNGLQTLDPDAFNGLHFYDTDGSTPLTVTVHDLAGATFSGTAAQLVKQIPAVPAHSVATYQITATADSGARLTPSDGWTVTAGGDCTFSIALQPGYALTSVQAVNATVYSDGSAYHVTNARGPVALTVATVYVADQADSGSAGGDSGTDEITTAVAIAAGAAVICAIIGLAFWRKL